jgi:hypothetical protein
MDGSWPPSYDDISQLTSAKRLALLGWMAQKFKPALLAHMAKDADPLAGVQERLKVLASVYDAIGLEGNLQDTQFVYKAVEFFSCSERELQLDDVIQQQTNWAAKKFEIVDPQVWKAIDAIKIQSNLDKSIQDRRIDA